ncbi:MAG: extracellular solute-binding protein, partial [Angelakisella sp.]
SAPESKAEGVQLPLTDQPVTLTVWRPLHPSAAKYITNTSETDSAVALEKATGVHVEYTHPPVGQESTSFSILLASGDYPDITQMNNVEYPGGGDAALNDGVFLKLNDLIDKYAPDYKALRESSEEKRKMTITDNGNIWAFYHMNDLPEGPFNGMSVRGDWLTELGLPMPETIEDWHTTLKAFKDKKGCVAPLVVANNGTVGYKSETFASAFGVAREFYVDQGQVKYGPTQPGYREYIETMHKWYAEGLIDSDFLTRTNLPYMAYPPMDMVGNDQSGAFPNNWDMTGEYWVEMGSAKDAKFFAQPVPAPVKNKGDKLHIGFATYSVLYPSAISAQCKNPEIAVKWLNFLYTKQGSDILNYGEEGKTFTYVDGKPTYTDEIMKPADGRTPRDAIISKTYHDGMGLMDYRRFWQVSNTDRLGAIKTWQSNNDYTGNMPAVSLTVEEADQRNSIYPDILTLVNERTVQYIIGTADMSTYDAFVKQLGSMGIDKVIGLYQAALDRYNKR